MSQERALRSRLYRAMSADKRVWYVDGQADGCADWLITLRPGWCSNPMGPEHTIGANTLSEAMYAVRQAQPCDCEQCLRELAEQKPDSAV